VKHRWRQFVEAADEVADADCVARLEADLVAMKRQLELAPDLGTLLREPQPHRAVRVRRDEQDDAAHPARLGAAAFGSLAPGLALCTSRALRRPARHSARASKAARRARHDIDVDAAERIEARAQPHCPLRRTDTKLVVLHAP